MKNVKIKDMRKITDDGRYLCKYEKNIECEPLGDNCTATDCLFKLAVLLHDAYERKDWDSVLDVIVELYNFMGEENVYFENMAES